MSGEAGASIESGWYALFVGAGMRKCFHVETDEQAAAADRWFEEQSAPYRAWLARAQTALDALFDGFVASGLPLARFEGGRGTRLDGSDLLGGGSLEVTVTTTAPLSKVQAGLILDGVAQILRRTRDGAEGRM
jgi:hypothetical protein